MRPESTLKASALNKAVAAVNHAEKNSTIPPAKAVFHSIGVLLTFIRVCFLLLQPPVPGSHIARTRQSMNQIMSSFVARSAKCSMGGLTESN